MVLQFVRFSRANYYTENIGVVKGQRQEKLDRLEPAFCERTCGHVIDQISADRDSQSTQSEASPFHSGSDAHRQISLEHRLCY